MLAETKIVHFNPFFSPLGFIWILLDKEVQLFELWRRESIFLFEKTRGSKWHSGHNPSANARDAVQSLGS